LSLAGLRLLLLVIWCSIATLMAQAVSGDKGEWEQAVDLQHAGDLEGAVKAYRKVLDQSPGRFDALSNLGATLAGLGRYQEAIASYEQALLTAPQQYLRPLKGNIAIAYYKSGQYAKAITVIVEIKRSGASDINLDLLLADCYLQNGEPSLAADTLGPYESTAPGNKALAYALGTALIRSGQVPRGQKIIDVLLREGDKADSSFLLGMTAFFAKDYPGAVKHLAEAVALNCRLPSLYSYYGQSLLLTGDPDGAIDAFHRALADNSNDYEANLRLGEILLSRHSFDEARPLIEKAGWMRPDSKEAQLDLAELQVAAGNYVQAVETLEAAIARQPDAAAPHFMLARTYSALGRKTDAASETKIAAELTQDERGDSGPKLGDLAPHFSLATVSSGEQIALAEFRSGRSAVLVFGSYTCPNFREQAAAINKLAEKYSAKTPFLLVYIREAHDADTWQSTINKRQGINWPPAETMPEMHSHANLCLRKLAMKFPAVVDGLDGRVASEYSAWPSRLFVLDKQGRVAYRTRLNELDFNPSELEAAIVRAAK